MRAQTTSRRRRGPFRVRAWMVVVLVVLVVLVLSARALATFYTDYLWFDSVGFGRTWRQLLWAKIAPAAVFTVVFFVLSLVSLTIADRMAPSARSTGPEDEFLARYQEVVGRFRGRLRVVVSLVLALAAGGAVSAQWRQWILFTHKVNFGIKDPQFHKDVGFYVFQLPFLSFIFDWLFASLLVILVVTAVAHYLNGGIRLQGPFQRVTAQVKAHLSVILGLMALAKTGQYFLGRYALDFSRRGVVQGASKTEVAAHLPALNLLMVISVVAAGLFVWNIWRRGWVLPVIAVGLWAFVSLVIGTIAPAVYQQVRVNPNELQQETRYISRNIASTREAFGLKNVSVKQFPYAENLNEQSIANGAATIDNTRLWDQSEILKDFQSLQALQTFYQFGDADVDRYTLDGNETLVMLSARGLNRNDLPSQTWVNRHLVYTHGYGAVVSPGNSADSGGFPEFGVSDIPPVTSSAVDRQRTLAIDKPQVYFGENLQGYALVDARQQEFDFPRKGLADATTRYSGKGGVHISNVFQRAAFAARFLDWNLLVSSQVTPNSRILFVRSIQDRVAKAAPFLQIDSDPYPVIEDGRIVWILDGYTTSNAYPYSQSTSGDGGLSGTYNYVRNSVKITVDAYDGTMRFYVIDNHDPIIRAYEKAFPGLFHPIAQMPSVLRGHLRYPQDLFKLQTNVYRTYHMTNPTTFYNKTDLWEVSPDPGSGAISTSPGTQAEVTSSTNQPQAASSTGQRIAPIYVLIRLPDQPKEEFLLLRPFVPVSKDNALTNLVSFMVAKSDPQDYGQLQSFVMPEGTTVFGPEQANATIKSTQAISTQFTLLGNTGSQVIQGSLQLIPIDHSILYIRPIYIQADTGAQLPTFRFVVVVYGQTAVIDTCLQGALSQLFGGPACPGTSGAGGGNGGGAGSGSGSGGGGATTTTTIPNTPGGSNPTVQQDIAQANTLFQQAQDTLKQTGDLGRYQTLMNQVGALLQKAAGAAGGSTTTTTTVPASGATTTSPGPGAPTTAPASGAATASPGPGAPTTTRPTTDTAQQALGPRSRPRAR